MTGRTPLWEEVIRIASDNPVLGVGYGGFWVGDNVLRMWAKFDWGPESAHNGFLDLWLELGFIGCGLLVGFLVQSYKNMIARLRINYNFGVLQFMLFSIAVIYNYTESSLLKPSSLLWIMLVLVTIDTGHVHGPVGNATSSTNRL